MIRRLSTAFAALLGLTLAAGTARAQSAQDLRIPVPGTGQALAARLCRPAGDGPATLVAIAHGSAADAAARPGMDLHDCGDEAAQWFLSRGYAVVFALRRGYGATGGAWAENYGACDRPDFVRAGLETARDIDATVAATTALPGIRRSGAVVVGQSAGGWGTLAYDSRPHRKVAALVVMAGGRGGTRAGGPTATAPPRRWWPRRAASAALRARPSCGSTAPRTATSAPTSLRRSTGASPPPAGAPNSCSPRARATTCSSAPAGPPPGARWSRTTWRSAGSGRDDPPAPPPVKR